MKLTRRMWPLLIAALALLLFSALSRQQIVQPIRIGVLHSLSGTMASNERPLVDAVRLAVDEINAAGGLLGRPVEMLVADGRSDNNVFATEAERLVSEEKVSALFACWTSSCRKTLKPLVEKYNHLLIYPLQYEGLEQSPNIYYTGPIPNQQIIPGTRWAMDNLGKRIYLLGSDHIYPRSANFIIRDMVKAHHGLILSEHYLPEGEENFSAIIQELRKLKPDAVLNTLNGNSNTHFFRALHQAGLGKQAVMSFSADEVALQDIGAKAFHPQHYAVWSYFQSIPGAANQRFVTSFRTRFGAERVTSDPIESSYVGVQLWAQAVRDAASDEPAAVNSAMLLQSIAAPSGIAAIDYTTRHMWKQVYIGKAQPDGQFQLIWSAQDTLRPSPFPDMHHETEWNQLLLSHGDKP